MGWVGWGRVGVGLGLGRVRWVGVGEGRIGWDGFENEKTFSENGF